MQTDLATDSRRASLSLATVCLIAATALAVAMGIGRFAFTPLLPLMVRDGSLAASAGPWLAASNYLGYLAGALTAARSGLSAPALMRASLIGVVATTVAMGVVDGAALWSALRFAAGVFSAWALISVSAWALQHLMRAGRGDLSGLVYAGVGLGIAIAGVFCIVAAQPGVLASWIWLGLGALAALAVAPVSVRLGRTTAPVDTRRRISASALPRTYAGLVVAYGALGFGYILPATFLPVLAREVWDDPQVFGLAWPLFGAAAALSTIALGWFVTGTNRLRVWASSHAVMAIGVALPSVWLTPAAIAVSAMAVGSTFMVATMVGLQEARARAPDNPASLLGAMTAAFAVGQLAGPIVSGIIGLLDTGASAALGYALQLAAFILALSALYLWRQRPGAT